jgi:hypothetical protein
MKREDRQVSPTVLQCVSMQLHTADMTTGCPQSSTIRHALFCFLYLTSALSNASGKERSTQGSKALEARPREMPAMNAGGY